MKERIYWLDYAKFFAISLMVICHTSVPQTFDNVVHAFHMPVFFIISGWCFNIKKHKKPLPFIASRAKSLLIPYLFWGVLLYAGWQIFYCFYDTSKLISLSNFLYYFLYSNAEYSPFCAVQWFLSCMFLCSVISFFIINRLHSRPVLLTTSAVLLAASGYIAGFLPVRLPLSFDVALSASSFYILGFMIPNVIKPVISKRMKSIILSPVTLIFEFLTGIGISILNGYVNMRTITFSNPILFYLSAAILSLAVMHLSYLLCKIKPLKIIVFYGQNTLPILMLNQLFIQSVRLVFPNLTYIQWYAWAVIIMLLMAPVIIFLNRFIPFSVGKKR